MDPTMSDYFQTSSSSGKKKSKLSWPSWTRLKKFFHRHFPQDSRSDSKEKVASQTSQATDVKYRWKVPGVNVFFEYGDSEGQNPANLAQGSFVEPGAKPSYETSPSPDRAFGKSDAQSASSWDSLQKPQSSSSWDSLQKLQFSSSWDSVQKPQSSSSWDSLQKPSTTSARYKTKPCAYFQAGYCKYGDNCTSLHVPADTLGRTVSARYKTKPCVYFQSGYCKCGDDCTFLHVPAAISSSQNGSKVESQRRPAESQECRTELHERQAQSQQHRAEPQNRRAEFQDRGTQFHECRDKSEERKTESHKLQAESQDHRPKIQEYPSESQERRPESQKCRISKEPSLGLHNHQHRKDLPTLDTFKSTQESHRTGSGLTSSSTAAISPQGSDKCVIAKFEVPDPQSIENEIGHAQLRRLVCPPPLQKPLQVACFSRMSDGNVHCDDRNLQRFRAEVLSESGHDLNEGFKSFTKRKERRGGSGFGALLYCLRSQKVSLEDTRFVAHRNMLTKILGTIYDRRFSWEMGVHKHFGIIYLHKRKLPKRSPPESQLRPIYWGYAFELLATEDRNGDRKRLRAEDSTQKGMAKGPPSNRRVDPKISFCSVLRTKIGSHKIVMAAEMDCYEDGESGKRSYIELKTARTLEDHSGDNFEKEKLMTCWIQSFLAGVPRIVFGFRDEKGILVESETMSTASITQREKAQRFWEGGVCLDFADKVLTWLYDTLNENEDYFLRFSPRHNSLELSPGACPESITVHLAELSENA